MIGRTTDEYDAIVVGAGSAGCVVADRLSADGSRRVLLLESGVVPRAESEFPPELLDAGTVRGAAPDGAHSWTFPALLTSDRPYGTVRGRILGGSSTTNGGYFIRPRRSDLEAWARLGGEQWSPAATLGEFIALEDDRDAPPSRAGDAGEIHGRGGPIPVERTDLGHPAAALFGAAATELGFLDDPDKNAEEPPGFGPVPCNVSLSVRRNAGMSFVLPALRRPNLTVRGGATVVRVLVEHGRAVGVEVRGPGSYGRGVRGVVRAPLVVMCAGAVKSAQLLMLSGIGPERRLSALGVPVVVDASRVGQSFGDHPQVVIEWQPERPTSAPPGGWLGGALHTDGVEVLGTLKPMAALLDADHADDESPLALMTSVMTPSNHGVVWLRSADPDEPPRLDYHYLSTGEDRRRMRDAVRLSVELLRTTAWSKGSARDTAPDPRTLADDALLDAWVREHLGTSLHTCGTIPFGDDAAPVDVFGHVRGVDGLVVADTSILPTAPTRGPAVAALLVGAIVGRALADSHAGAATGIGTAV
ncbi:mycofactocin system GMC family oxidoreductase MftG [Humibacter soli]